MLEVIFQVVIAATSGAVAAIVAPWAHWGVEKRRERLNHQRQQIAAWRRMLRDFTNGPQDVDLRWYLERHEDFYSLQPLLSSEYRHRLYSDTTWIVPAREDTIGPLAQGLLDEIGRIEREWGLIKSGRFGASFRRPLRR